MKALLVLALVALPVYAEDKPPRPKATVGAIARLDRPAAMVAGKVLWESHVQDRIGVGEKGDRTKLVEEMIDEMLWLRRGEELGVTVDDEEVKLAFEEIKKQNNLDDPGIDKLLAGFALRDRLEQVMRLPGVGRVEVNGRQLADGITLTFVIVPAPKLRKLTALDDGKAIAITGMGAMPTGLAVDPARIDQIAERVRTQLASPTRRSVEVQWRKVPVEGSAEVDIILEVSE